jgi:hypothetical protein
VSSAFRSTVYVRIRRRWLGVRVLTWSGRVHVWEGAAEAVLTSSKKGQVTAVPSMAALPSGVVLSRPFTAFAHPRVVLDSLDETEAVVRAWLRQSGWRPTPRAVVVLHVVDAWDGGLSQLELRALMELGKRIGAKRTMIVEGGNEFTDPELLGLVRTRDVPVPYRPAEVVR